MRRARFMRIFTRSGENIINGLFAAAGPGLAFEEAEEEAALLAEDAGLVTCTAKIVVCVCTGVNVVLKSGGRERERQRERERETSSFSRRLAAETVHTFFLILVILESLLLPTAGNGVLNVDVGVAATSFGFADGVASSFALSSTSESFFWPDAAARRSWDQGLPVAARAAEGAGEGNGDASTPPKARFVDDLELFPVLLPPPLRFILLVISPKACFVDGVKRLLLVLLPPSRPLMRPRGVSTGVGAAGRSRPLMRPRGVGDGDGVGRSPPERSMPRIRPRGVDSTTAGGEVRETRR